MNLTNFLISSEMVQLLMCCCGGTRKSRQVSWLLLQLSGFSSNGLTVTFWLSWLLPWSWACSPNFCGRMLLASWTGKSISRFILSLLKFWLLALPFLDLYIKQVLLFLERMITAWLIHYSLRCWNESFLMTAGHPLGPLVLFFPKSSSSMLASQLVLK